MRHRLFTLCSALSLLLCAAVAALWAFSYRNATGITVELPGKRWEVNSLRGRLLWSNRPQRQRERLYATLRGSDLQLQSWRWYDRYHAAYERAHGLNWESTPELQQLNQEYRQIEEEQRSLLALSRKPPATFSLPHRFVIGLTAILPACWIIAAPRRRERRRIAQGLCPRCGYDLRASPGRCPECGAERVGFAGETRE